MDDLSSGERLGIKARETIIERYDFDTKIFQYYRALLTGDLEKSGARLGAAAERASREVWWLVGPMRALSYLLVTVAIGMISTTAAGEDRLPGIIGADDRQILTEAGSPWDAVGQVNIGGFRTSGQCTGTLVAPTLVITAAHCLRRPGGKSPFPAHDIHFLAGLRGDKDLAHATARCLHLPPNLSSSVSEWRSAPEREDALLKGLASDVAVIVLDTPLAVEPAPLARSVMPPHGLQIVHVAYPADRRFLPVADSGCRVLHSTERFWFTNCDTYPGSSGGPLFIRDDGAYRVAAIMVAAGGASGNIALPLAGWIDLVDILTCP